MTQQLATNGYMASETLRALTTSGNVLRFRYEWLGKDNSSKGWLDDVIAGCTVNHNYLAQIKGTCNLTIVDPEDKGFDFYNDRIRPWVGVQMPDGGWADWPQGVFLLSSPTRAYDKGLITRVCDGFDQSQVLIDDPVTSTYVASAGSAYTDVIRQLVSAIPNTNIADSDATLPADRTWDPGTTKYQIVADLITSLAYGSMYFDAYGVLNIQPYVNPSDAPVTLTYSTESMQVIAPKIDQSLDLFHVPNMIVLVVTQPNRPVLRSQFINSDPNSPTSTVSRGRRVIQFEVNTDAATQAELDSLTKQKAMDLANVYEHISMSTVIMPVHEDRDAIMLIHDGLGVSAKYTETAWSFQMSAGAPMAHTFRRVINIDSSLLGDPTADTGA